MLLRSLFLAMGKRKRKIPMHYSEIVEENLIPTEEIAVPTEEVATPGYEASVPVITPELENTMFYLTRLLKPYNHVSEDIRIELMRRAKQRINNTPDINEFWRKFLEDHVMVLTGLDNI